MNTPQDNNEREQRLKARKRVRQRQRRQGVKRIDYQPSEQVLALITVELRPYVGGDFSSVIDRLILKAAGVAPVIVECSRERARASELGGSKEGAGIWRPVRAHANDFARLPAGMTESLPHCKVQYDAMRVVCGGRRRSDGKPCEALSVPGKRRCKWHGGCSTGPRTAEGKVKVSRNLRVSRNKRER
jgi:hypothetical protein